MRRRTFLFATGATAAGAATTAVQISRDHGFGIWLLAGNMHLAIANGLLGNVSDAIAALTGSLETWRIGGAELSLAQKYQMVSGKLKSGDRLTLVTGGRLNGDEIRFNAGNAAYTGRVHGDVIEGTVRSGGRTEKWQARRTSHS